MWCIPHVTVSLFFCYMIGPLYRSITYLSLNYEQIVDERIYTCPDCNLCDLLRSHPCCFVLPVTQLFVSLFIISGQQSTSNMKVRVSPTSSSGDVPSDRMFAVICSEKQARVRFLICLLYIPHFIFVVIPVVIEGSILLYR